MKKQTSRIAAVVGLMAFALVALTAASSGSTHARQANGSELNAPVPSPTPPAKKAVEKIVATCNTARGCEALKTECKSLKKHTFKATDADGKLGMCVEQTTAFFLKNSNSPDQPNNKPTADVGLTAPKPTSEATLYCHGTVMCRKVKNICAALGGDYTPVYDTSGSCNY